MLCVSCVISCISGVFGMGGGVCVFIWVSRCNIIRVNMESFVV